MEAKDEALTRVGRNVANFQKLEFALKIVIPTLQASGTLAQINTQIEQNRKSLKKSTLGDLSECFHSSIFKTHEEYEPIDTITEPVFSFSIRREASVEFIKTFKSRWRKLVSQRNKLVHSQLLEYNFNNDDDCKRLITTLDIQNLEVCAMLKELADFESNRVKAVEKLLQVLDDDAHFEAVDTPPDGA